MANVSYDTLTIQINADSEQASKSIKTLSTNLRNLEKIAQQLDFETIGKVQKCLQDIANIDFSNVSKGLQDVVSAFKQLKGQTKFTKQIDSTKEMVQSQIGGSSVIQENIGDDLGIDKAIEQTEDLAKKIDDVNERLPRFEQLRNSIFRIVKMTDNVKESVDKVGDSVKKAGHKWVEAFKRVAFYRIIRRTLQLIMQSITNSIQDLAKFDTAFNNSISEIKSSFSYLSRTIVSLIAPVIKLLSPFISFITNSVGELFSQLGEILAGALGQDTFDEAKQSAEDYAKSLEKVKSVALGIDELNVVSQDDESVNWQIKNIEASNDLATTIKKITDEWKPIFESLKDILTDLKPILDDILGEVKYFIDNTSDSIHDSIVDLNGLIESVIGLLNQILDALEPLNNVITELVITIVNMVNDVLSGVFEVLSVIVDILGEILSPAIKIIANLLSILLSPLVYVLKAISEALKVILSFDWSEQNAKIWEQMSARLLDDFVRAILGGLDAIINIFKPDWGDTLVENYGGGLEERRGFDTSAKLDTGYRTPIASGYDNTSSSSNGSTNGDTQVNVYIDGEEVAKRVNQYNNNRGTNTFRGGTLSYVK